MSVPDIVFEQSWEVCNKVGGIYTVLATKAALMTEKYSRYFCIGPYFRENAMYELNEQEPPHQIRAVFDSLAAEGIHCYYGTWRVKGEPTTILVDHRVLIPRASEYKNFFWEKFGIDSINAGYDFDEPAAWCWAVSMLIQRLLEGPFKNRKAVSHHHEWMSALSLLALKDWGVKVATVFTTHATMLGRSLMSHGIDLYAELDNIVPEQSARDIGVLEKWSTEKACAHHCDVFTTVSEITSLEAEKLLGKKPDVLVLNGLDAARFPTFEETSIKHVTSRDALREYLMYHFFPYYHNFDLEHNLILCISGRYEYENKGVDVFIKALGKLNEHLRRENSSRTITVFFWVIGGTNGTKQEVLENKNYYRHIRHYVRTHSQDILQRIIKHFITSDDPSKESLYSQEFMARMRSEVLHFRREGNPLLSSFHMHNENDDIMIKELLAQGLDNLEDDKVKIVVQPVYLDGNDGLIDMPYYDALAGCHLAVFPSKYEPWGYTPLEAAAMGVPSITTDLAGFGRYIDPHTPQENPGIFVIQRQGKSYDDIVEDLFQKLLAFVNLSKSDRVQNKMNAKQLSRRADWNHFITFYFQAHSLALERRGF